MVKSTAWPNIQVTASAIVIVEHCFRLALHGLNKGSRSFLFHVNTTYHTDRLWLVLKCIAPVVEADVGVATTPVVQPVEGDFRGRFSHLFCNLSLFTV